MTLRAQALLGISFLVGLAFGADRAPLPSPTDFRPHPELVRYANEHGLPLDRFELAENADGARVGDAITILFVVQEGSASRQWLAEFRSDLLTESEATAKPGSGFGLMGRFFSSLTTDTGHRYDSTPSPLAIVVQTVGPFPSADARIAPARTRVVVGREYLIHGLMPMCEIETRLRNAGKQDPELSFKFRPHFTEAQIAAAKSRAATAGFTTDDERVFAEGFLGLVQFAYLNRRIPGLSAITQELIDPPSVFSGGFINPVWVGLRSEAGEVWGLPNTRIFTVPYNYLSKTNARGSLYVTSPQPPLQNSGGIIGLTIDWSAKAPTKRLIMRVLASRRGNP